MQYALFAEQEGDQEPPDAPIGERDIRIGAEGYQLLLAVELAGRTPELGAIGPDFNKHIAAIGVAARLFPVVSGFEFSGQSASGYLSLIHI